MDQAKDSRGVLEFQNPEGWVRVGKSGLLLPREVIYGQHLGTIWPSRLLVFIACSGPVKL